MSQELPDGVELPEILDGLPRLLWDSVQGLNAEEDAGWSPDAHMHLRKLNSAVNMMREQGCLADREKQAARVPKFINEQEAINHYLLTAAPTEPSKPEQAEGVRWLNYEAAMADPLFQQARAIMGTENWFQDNALRNAINYVLSQQNEAVSGNGESDPLTSADVIHDASRASQESRHGKNQRDQHRSRETGADRAHDQSTGRRDGVHGACDVSAKVDATPPASAAGERELFETWYSPHCHPNNMPRLESGYWDKATQNAWVAWQARAALASKPLPEQVVQDKERIDWLCTQYVTVRTPLRYGSRECFLGSPADQDGEMPEPWDIRAAIDAARTRGEGSGT